MTMDNTVELWYSCLNKESNLQTYNQILQRSYACHGHSSTKEMKCVKGRLLQYLYCSASPIMFHYLLWVYLVKHWLLVVEQRLTAVNVLVLTYWSSMSILCFQVSFHNDIYWLLSYCGYVITGKK